VSRIWRKFNSSLVTNTLISVGIRIALVIALMTTASYFHIYYQVKDSKLAELQVYTQERSARESQIFQLAEDNHQLLKQAFLDEYKSGYNADIESKFTRKYQAYADGAIRSNKDRFNPQQSAGMWIASGVKVTENLKLKTVIANQLVSDFGKSWRNRFINTYALGPENFATIYWPEIPDFVYRMTADFDIRTEEYFDISTPAKNPSAETVWTGVYRDQQADLWMVSVETPIYVDEKHIATIGNDIALDELFNRTIVSDPDGAYDLIFRADGRLIAHPHYVEELKASSGSFLISEHTDQQLQAIYQATISDSNDKLIELGNHEMYLMVSQIKGPDWNYVRVVPKSIITNVASSSAAIVFLFGVIALVFEMLVLCYVMKKKITWPLVQLTRGTLAIARGHTAKQIDGVRSDELGRLARTFTTMSQRVDKRDQQLAQSAKELENQIQQLKVSEQKLEHAQSIAQLGSWEYYPESKQLTVSSELTKILQVKKIESLSLKSILKLVTNTNDVEFSRVIKDFIIHGKAFRYTHKLTDLNNETRFVHSTGEIERDERGEIKCYLGTVQDLSKQIKTEEIMRDSETRFRNAFHNSPISMAIVGLDGSILLANDTLCKTFGYSNAEVNRMNFETLVHPDERKLSKEKLNNIVAGKATAHEVERKLQNKDGQQVWCSINVFVQKDSQGKPDYIFVQGMDITKRKQAEKELNKLAFHDPLTGLANRTMFIEFLNKAISNHKRDPQRKFAVLFLDLDGFKFVNDSLGHLEGDKLLAAIAKRLVKETRASDTLARFGGDEFCILVNDLASDSVATELAIRINRALNEPFKLDSEQVKASASIGIILANSNLDCAQDYLRDADSAMYHAKHQGHGQYAIFDASMHSHAKQQLRLRNEINLALENNDFIPYYQPIINCQTGLVTSFEALVRWNHPKQGLLTPMQFLETVEDIKRITEIDIAMMDSALLQLKRWHLQFGEESLSVNCNCSSEFLATPQIIDIILQLIDKHQLPPECLNLEITESVLVNDPETTMAILYRLQDLGFRIHLDDFGTGYSSLSYLHRFPIHNIKIDRSFISRILDSDKDYAIVESIILLANRLGISVTAEGVENQRQYTALENIGVARSQGYFHGKPTSVEQASLLLNKQAAQISH